MKTPFAIDQATSKGFYKGTAKYFGQTFHKFQWTQGSFALVSDSDLQGIKAIDEKDLIAAIEASQQSIEEFYQERPQLID